MFYLKSKKWQRFLNESLKALLEKKALPYSLIKPSILPAKAGVYLISELIEKKEVALYIGRSKNIQTRIYTNHLMGSISNARLKKYIIQDQLHSCFGDVKAAKHYIRSKCFVRWIFEDDIRKRGALEGYFTAMLFPKYGIYEEH